MNIEEMLDELSSVESELRRWEHWEGDEADHQVRQLERKRDTIRQKIAALRKEGGAA